MATPSDVGPNAWALVYPWPWDNPSSSDVRGDDGSDDDTPGDAL